VIPNEAVEAAAKILDFHLPDATHESGCAMRCGYSGDELAEHLAVHLLEAAAPHLMESAYELGWEDGREGTRSAVWWEK